MKHCESCVYCKHDMRAWYIKGLSEYKCAASNKQIGFPSFQGLLCKNYKRVKKVVLGTDNTVWTASGSSAS